MIETLEKREIKRVYIRVSRRHIDKFVEYIGGADLPVSLAVSKPFRVLILEWNADDGDQTDAIESLYDDHFGANNASMPRDQQ